MEVVNLVMGMDRFGGGGDHTGVVMKNIEEGIRMCLNGRFGETR